MNGMSDNDTLDDNDTLVTYSPPLENVVPTFLHRADNDNKIAQFQYKIYIHHHITQENNMKISNTQISHFMKHIDSCSTQYISLFRTQLHELKK